MLRVLKAQEVFLIQQEMMQNDMKLPCFDGDAPHFDAVLIGCYLCIALCGHRGDITLM